MEQQTGEFGSLYDRMTCLTADELMSVAQVATMAEVAQLALRLCLEQHEAAVEIGNDRQSIEYEMAAHYIELLI